MSDTELHDLLVEVASQAAPTDLLPRVQGGLRTRTRRRRAIAVVSAAATVAAVVGVATQVGRSDGSHPAARAVLSAHPRGTKTGPSSSNVKTVKARGVKLVAYTGKQPPGFTVAEIPDGWVLGGVNSFALTINPAGDENTDPAYFVGKLVVTLQPPGSNLRTDGPKRGGLDVTVNGQDGLVSGLGSSAGPAVAFYDSAGNVVDIEVPPALGWTAPGPIVAFAEGIRILPAAQPGFG